MKKYLLITSILLLASTVFGQNENPKSGGLSLDFVNGISMPNGGFEDFAKDGFNTELSLTKSFCEKLAIGFGAKHSSFNVRQDFGPVQGSRNQFTNTTFDMGPQFSLGSEKFAIELYGRTGLSVSSTPEIKMMQANTDITIGKMDQQSMKALSARVGAKIKTEICTGLQLFVSGEYVSTLNSDMNFYSKDLSKAIDAEGRIDPDLAGEIPFSTKSMNFSSLNVNFGVSIALGSCCKGKSSQRSSNPLYQGNGKAMDNTMFQKNSRAVNPMYQQNSNQGENPIYEGANNVGGNTGGSSGTRASDYNSSRSNRTTSSSILNNEGENGNNDGNNRAVEATDYNSSRSNKQGVAASSGDDGNDDETSGIRATDYNSSRSNRTTSSAMDNNGNNGGTKASDYNSSRSNRTTSSSILNNEGENGNNDGNNRAVEATDYNSSRSNRTTSSAMDNNGNNGGTKASDYNSSRSNRTTSSSIMNNENENGNNDGNNRAVEATDYNSSRSNKQGIVDTNDDIRVSMTQADKRKMIKKLKREERARLKEEKKKSQDPSLKEQG